MLRTSTAASTRILTRALRGRHGRPEAARTRKLRLDSLETREQPGSVMAVGLAGAGMLEPLQVMAAVVGTKVPAQPSPDAGAIAPPSAGPRLTFPDLASRL
jgi:hypothetical protein